MQLYAHRGASQTYPENTIAAFAEAVRLGVDGIELDIHATADGVPVIIHDASLSRTATSDAVVTDLTLKELRTVAPSVPTFDDVLKLVGSSIHLDVEVKQAGVEPAVLDTLARYPDARWSISSFDWSVLAQFRALDPTCDLWLLSPVLSDELVDTAHRLGATAAALYAPGITEDTVHHVHKAGLKVMAWTVNDVERAEQLDQWGTDAFCTDAPQLFVH
jgi:glycerophosphoryl diester phosphodiesterase